MSYFEDASLVLIPSAQKLSKIYSAKPTDGTGDLTFTRSNDTATRVGPDGLIEKVRTNLLLYSNDFSNAAWGKSNATLTGGQSGYDGTTNGWKLEATATSCYISQGGYSVLRNHSIYVKAGTFNLVSIIVGGYGQGVTFNLTTGAVVTNTNSALYSPVITSVGSGWYRISVGIQAAAPTYGMLIAPNDINGGTISAGQFIYIQAAQTEYNDIATDYIATTSAAVSVGPVANVPRLDYLNSSCPRLLLEPQRTNLVLYSEQFNDASWTKGGTAISANTSATLDPSGFNGADKLVEDSSTGVHRVFNNSSVVVSNSVATTYSVFAKAAERTQIYLRDNDIVGARFNLSTGAVISTEGTATATITNYGNGWYRCTITRVSSTTSGRVIVYLDNGGDSYTGNGTSGVYIFGAQIETSAAYATSYIGPTLGAAVTRGADAATTASVPSLIGQTEGTIFIEYNRTNTFEGAFFMLSNLVGTTVNAYQNSFYFLQQANGTMVVEVYVAAAPQVLFTVAALSVGTHKMALTYKANDFALYVDGVQLGTDTSGSVPTTNFLSIGGAVDGGVQKQSVNQALLFKTRLTNAQLAELTTI